MIQFFGHDHIRCLAGRGTGHPSLFGRQNTSTLQHMRCKPVFSTYYELSFETLLRGLEGHISIIVKVENTEFFTKTIDVTLTTS